MSLWRRLPAPGRAGLTLASVALVFFLYWLKVPLLDLVELRTYDLRFQSRGDVAAVPDVVLAVVDEKSLDALGRWPWSRARIAELVDALSAGGARVIAFDIGFLEREAAAPDRALARAIERSPAAVVLGYFFHMASERGYDVAPEVRDRELERLEANALTVRMRASDLDKSPFAQAKAVEGNLPELADAAEGAGFFTLVPDDDGVVRRTPLVIEAEGEVYPSLALVAAWNALGQPPLVVDVVQNHVADIQLGDRIVPTDEGGNLLVNFPGKAGAFPQVSISDVLAGDVAPDRFRDKIVLVGVTATAVFDLRATPFGPVNPGLEVQAAALDNLLSGRFMSRPGWADLADQLAIVLLGVTTGLLLAQLGALSGLVATALLAVAYVALAEQLFVRAGAWIGVTYPLLALVVVYTAITLHAYLREQRERRRVSGAFGQYVSPVVIEQMLADPEKLRLGGEERVLTVLFCDLAGFTGIAERNSPQTTIELLSEYYARMTEQIYACEGMLKEYVGDELMAIFGAPLPQPDHAVRACRAALALREARLALSQEWMKLGRPALRARTGVNTGLMLVGNIGSRYRFSYGVVGDPVNMASRREHLNRMFGTEILIGEQTAELIGDAFRLRELDRVRVVGKAFEQRVFELVSEAGVTLGPEREKVLAHYQAALAEYRERRFAPALGELDAALAIEPADGPSRMLAERCRSWCDAPPPADWEPVYVATEK
jgi:adenylate cyclase